MRFCDGRLGEGWKRDMEEQDGRDSCVTFSRTSNLLIPQKLVPSDDDNLDSCKPLVWSFVLSGGCSALLEPNGRTSKIPQLSDLDPCSGL
jgi:hypothetical protein